MNDQRRKLTVVIGVTSRSWGGNEKWAAEAARGLLARGHDVTALWSYAPVHRELEARGVPSRRIRLWGDVNPVGLSSLVRLLRELRPDVLVLTKQREYWMGGFAALLAGRPLVVLRLGIRRALRDDYKRRASFGRFADLVIVNSRDILETVTGAEWLDASKVRVLLNGVELTAPNVEAGGRALRKLGVPEGARALVSAGRLTWIKGLDVLIDSFAALARGRPDAWLVILGEGGQRAALEDAARASGCGDRIVFAGYRTDVRDVIAASDVFVLSSRNEGMANALLEAMSVGAPIVATDVSGSREAVRDGVDALVVPPEDAPAIATAAVRLLEDRELAARLGASALERARERFGYARMAEEFEAMLLAGLAERADGHEPV